MAITITVQQNNTGAQTDQILQAVAAGERYEFQEDNDGLTGMLILGVGY